MAPSGGGQGTPTRTELNKSGVSVWADLVAGIRLIGVPDSDDVADRGFVRNWGSGADDGGATWPTRPVGVSNRRMGSGAWRGAARRFLRGARPARARRPIRPDGDGPQRLGWCCRHWDCQCRGVPCRWSPGLTSGMGGFYGTCQPRVQPPDRSDRPGQGALSFSRCAVPITYALTGCDRAQRPSPFLVGGALILLVGGAFQPLRWAAIDTPNPNAPRTWATGDRHQSDRRLRRVHSGARTATSGSEPRRRSREIATAPRTTRVSAPTAATPAYHS